MTRRKKTPISTETQVLTRSRRHCCICWGLGQNRSAQKGQIAHLDRDPANSQLDNLPWLCLPHHDEYDSKTSQAKGFTVDEVKIHRERMYRELEQAGTGIVGPAVVPANLPRCGRNERDTPPPPGRVPAGTLLACLDERIAEGESIRAAIKAVPGERRERWIYSRDEGRDYQTPDSYIVDWDCFVRWRTSCASLLSEMIPLDHVAHGDLPKQFATLECGKDQLGWGIATLEALREACKSGLLRPA
jgi:hypothetical protein